MEAVHRPTHVAGIDVRPPRIARRINPRGHARHFLVADRFLEARHASARDDRHDHAALDQIKALLARRRRCDDMRPRPRRATNDRQHVSRVVNRAKGSRHHRVAAALQRGRAGLIEDHVADAKEFGHHGNPEAEAAREHHGPHGTNAKRTKGEFENQCSR